MSFTACELVNLLKARKWIRYPFLIIQKLFNIDMPILSANFAIPKWFGCLTWKILSEKATAKASTILSCSFFFCEFHFYYS